MNDIELHIGPRKCGKSQIVEDELSSCVPKLYVGTLINHEYYKKSIEIHKERRNGKNWLLYETSTSLEVDFDNIEEIIQYTLIGNNGACMIDGLTTWITNSFSSSDWESNKKKLINFLIKILNYYTVKWRLVDVSPVDEYYIISSELHRALIKNIPYLKLIEYEKLSI